MPLFIALERAMGWTEKPGESEAQKLLRCSILSMLGERGQDKQTIAQARALFAKYRANHQAVAPNLVGTIFSIVAFNGGATEYKQMIELWKTAKNPADAQRALYSLGNRAS